MVFLKVIFIAKRVLIDLTVQSAGKFTSAIAKRVGDVMARREIEFDAACYNLLKSILTSLTDHESAN